MGVEHNQDAYWVQSANGWKFEFVNYRPRGYAFEKFLHSLFTFYGLKPREPFRNRGEQIDGSFAFGGNTYLLEAKWQDQKTGAEELRGSRASCWIRRDGPEGHL
jgi:hypothetical protein